MMRESCIKEEERNQDDEERGREGELYKGRIERRR